MKMRNTATVLWVGTALAYGILLSILPLLRELHFLSAALTALIGAFAAAYYASRLSGFSIRPASGLRELLMLLLLSQIPVFPLLISAFFRGCFSFEGLSFWLLLPPPSIMLGFAIGRYFRLFTSRPRFYSIGLLLFIAFGGLLFELLSYPQVYFHNHVWGYWPGPIYDEQVALTPSVVYFRLISLSWAGLFWLLPSIRLRRPKPAGISSQRGIQLLSGLLLLSLLLSYSNLSRNGIISPPEYLQERLGERSETELAIIYHDAFLSPDERQWIANKHDFHIREIAARLELDLDTLPRIQSYVYRHQWQKKRLTGAGNTVYVPVWQSEPQLHIQKDALDAVLRHELVHVVAREFGMPVLNASPNIALIEGLAVALEGPRNMSASLHQIIAAQPELPDVARMRQLMRPTGFYALSGSLSYNLAGSFVDWLLHEYPVEQFKQAYRSGRLSAGYDADFETLIYGWHDFLQQIEVDDSQLALSNRIFSAPGIAEKSCVFHISPEQRVMNTARRLQAERADSAALVHLRQFSDTSKRALSASFLQLWGEQALRESPEAASDFLNYFSKDDAAVSPRLQLLRADAHFITNNKDAGINLLQRFEKDDENKRPLSVQLRLRPETRSELLMLRYGTASSVKQLQQEPSSGLPPYGELPAALQPYALQLCNRLSPAAVDYCVFEPPSDQGFRYENASGYRLKESYARLLFAQGFHVTAAAWISYLERGLRQETQAEVLHAARLIRLEELSRLASLAPADTSGRATL